MTPEQYQQHELGLLATTFPDEQFEVSPDPFLIKHGKAELGLRDLYTLHTEKRCVPEERDAHIREHVWRILEALHLSQDAGTPDWEEARGKLRLQFADIDYLHRYRSGGETRVAQTVSLRLPARA